MWNNHEEEIWIYFWVKNPFNLSNIPVTSTLILHSPEQQHATHTVAILCWMGRTHRMGTVCVFVCKPLFPLWPKAGGGRGCSCPYLSCPTIVQAARQQRIETHRPLNHPSCSLDSHTHSFTPTHALSLLMGACLAMQN